MAGLPQPGARSARAGSALQQVFASLGNVGARPGGRLMAIVLALAMSAAGPRRLEAEAITHATSSRAAREDSLRSLPLNRLTPEARAKIVRVVQNPTVFRRMPVSMIYCDPRLHQFLLRNPEIVVNIWQLMGITKVSLLRTDDYSFQATDGMGTVADVELVYGDRDTHLYYCQGRYDGPVFPKTVTGRCVLLLKTGTVSTPEGLNQIINRMDVFLDVENIGVDVLTRTLHPLLSRSADQNFIETTRFIERIWRTAEKNGPGMQSLAERLEQVTAERRDQFARISAAIHTAAEQRASAAQLK